MSRSLRHINIAAYLMAFIVLCDQFTKWWIVEHVMQPPAVHPVASFLNLVLVWNKGITFGFLNSLNHDIMKYVLITVAVIILGLLGRWLWQTSSTLIALGLGCVMGGALGNVIDRVRYGAVVDFLDFYIVDFNNQAHHWYAFNIADAAIVTGVGLLLLDNLVRAR